MSATELERAISSYLADEFEVAPYGDERLACDTAIYYPDGESVTVFVTDRDGEMEVTDYGEGYARAIGRRGVRKAPIKVAALDICVSLGLEFSAGRISAATRGDRLADAVWRVATASARIADFPFLS